MRKVYILPNLFTAASLFCGLLAVLEMADALRAGVWAASAGVPAGVDSAVAAPSLPIAAERIKLACKLVLLAGFFDVLDGLIARLTRTQTPFGLNFDSLADVVSFGAAPAILSYAFISTDYNLIAKSSCGLYAICGALRLGRFNVQAAREERKTFLGLPIPGAGIALVSMIWVYTDHPAARAVSPELVLPLAMVALAALMVSTVPYYGLKNIALGKRQPFEILVVIIVAIAFLIALKEYFNLILMTGFVLYCLSGPIFHVYRRRKPRARSRALNDRPVSDGATRDTSSR